MAVMHAYQVTYQDGTSGPVVPCTSPIEMFKATHELSEITRVDCLTNVGIV